jgi:hypothetical protein
MRVMSVVSDGGSSASFSPLRGLLLFLGAGGVAAACWFGYGSLKNRATEPTTAPNCYGADEAYVPQNQTMPLMGAPDRNGVPNNRRRMGTSEAEKVFAAEKVCKPGACDPEALKAYKSAFFWYIQPRLQHIRQLDMLYGDNGLRLARTIYSDAVDLQIEKGLRDRYQAKAFRITDSREDRDAMAILIFKGGVALRSCRKSDL